MDGYPPLAGNIGERLAELTAAKRALDVEITDAQSKCEHLIVGFIDYGGRGYPPRRICLSCRLETEGSHWSSRTNWSDRDHVLNPELGNRADRLIVDITDRDCFIRLRLPGRPIHPRREKV